MAAERASIRERADAVRDRADIVAVVGAAVKLGRGRKPRGKCPFHGSKSDSFAVDPDRGAARCWGCGWSGDAIGFVRDHYGLSFLEALQRLEGEHGLDGLAASPVRREKRPQVRRDAPCVDSATMARFIWRTARPNPPALRKWFLARGVPEAALGADRFADLRLHEAAPVSAWPVVLGRTGPVDYSRPPRNWPSAPALVAMVRRPPEDPRDGAEWKPVGLHVTYLAPSLEAKMERRRRDGSLIDARKMLGGAGRGCVLLGRYAADAPIYAGEGLETVLSGMALAGADARALGLAALSLDNLQGFPLLWRKGVWPLHAIEPDPSRPPALAFPHDARVSVLVDADMKPLRGRETRGCRWSIAPADRSSCGRSPRPSVRRSARGSPSSPGAAPAAPASRRCGRTWGAISTTKRGRALLELPARPSLPPRRIGRSRRFDSVRRAEKSLPDRPFCCRPG
jgi:DNA primase